MTERDTPYDVVFRRGRIDFDARFDEVRAEAEQRGIATDDPERFIMLGSVGTLLREMMLDEEAADDAGELWQALPAHAIAQAGALLYHAYRFREAGGQLLTLDEPATRALLGDAATPPVMPEALPEAGYLQLPRNLVWARANEDGPAEPLDGFFFASGRRLDVLLALGVRARRPGFTAIPLACAAADLPRLAQTRARETGADFANILPGGEIDRLYGLTNAAEALALVARALLSATR